MTRREKIEERLHIEPEDVFLNYSYAMELAKTAEQGAARQVFQKVRDLDPNYISAYFQEGQMLANEGEIDAARQILTEGIAVARHLRDDHALAEMTDFLDSL